MKWMRIAIAMLTCCLLILLVLFWGWWRDPLKLVMSSTVADQMGEKSLCEIFRDYRYFQETPRWYVAIDPNKNKIVVCEAKVDLVRWASDTGKCEAEGVASVLADMRLICCFSVERQINNFSFGLSKSKLFFVNPDGSYYSRTTGNVTDGFSFMPVDDDAPPDNSQMLVDIAEGRPYRQIGLMMAEAGFTKMP